MGGNRGVPPDDGRGRLGPGSRVAEYVIEEQVGSGGIATVFRARDEALGRTVALKVLSPSLANDQDFRARFLRVVLSAERVREPHIVPVYAAGESDGVLYIATHFVADGDLGTLLGAQGPFDPDRAVSLTSQVAAALDAAHRAGLVHGDVKPGNVLIDDSPGRPEHAYLSDFGLSTAASSTSARTRSGAFVGTPDYYAPEQIGGLPVSPRTDQYSLACVAFALLAGTAPYARDSVVGTLYAHLQQPVPSLAERRPGLPSAVDAVLATAMAKDPTGRYRSCGEFATALATALRAPAGQATPTTPDTRPSPPAGQTPDATVAHTPVTAAAPPMPGTAAYTPVVRLHGLGTALLRLLVLAGVAIIVIGALGGVWLAFSRGLGGSTFAAVGAQAGFSLLVVAAYVMATQPARRRRKARSAPPVRPSVVGSGPTGRPPGGSSSGPRPPAMQPAQDGGEPADRRYLRARCPEVVRVGRPFSLIASISQTPMSPAAPLASFAVPAAGRTVLLVLHAPGLRLLGDHQLPVHVPPRGDSIPVMFELRADAAGARTLSVTAWLDGSYLGELLVGVTADHANVTETHRELVTEIDTTPSEGAVSLVVRHDPGLNAYRFEFRDQDNPGEVVSRLSFEPRQRIESLVSDLERLASGRSRYSPGQARDYLVNAGAELWRELVPLALREQFWERQHRIRQLTILADKDTVPWELLYPRDPGHDAGFLVQQFPVTRAIFGRRLAPRLSLWPARFVLPNGSLPQATAEIDVVRRLLDPVQRPESVIADLTPLQDLIRAGEFGLLHFACHNRFEPDENASIRLGSVQFTPRLMTTAVIDKVLERSAPTVFINACRSAGLAPTYNRLDGWASKFLEAGAGAFIGSLWAVSDETAREFAEDLYRQLTSGATLGVAVMHARELAAGHCADPTWLAYTVYGDPRATVRLP
jgi:serine/threonine protein kinase